MLYSEDCFQTQTRFKICWWLSVSASLKFPFGRNVQFGAAEESHLLLISHIESKILFDVGIVPMAESMEHPIRYFKNIRLSWGFRLDDRANATQPVCSTVSGYANAAESGEDPLRLSLLKLPLSRGDT